MPPSIAFPFLTALLFISNIVLQAYSQDQDTPFVTYCHGGSFNSSTPYDSSLRSLIAGLVNSTPNSPSYFLLTNSTRSPVIFGLAQCRPDITPAACAACLNKTASAAADTPPAGCALKNSGSLRSLNCLLRYSDQNFYSSVEIKMFVYQNEVQNASTFFVRQTQVLMNSVIGATAASSLRFGVDVANVTADALDIYGMGWCSMDLASDDCAQCLNFVLGKIPAGKNKGACGTVSCMMRFDNYQFYNNSILGRPSSPPATGGKSAKSKTIAIVAGASGAVALLLLFTFFILLLRRRNKKLTASKIRLAVEEEDLQSFEIQMIDFSTIRKATNKFANENKLGQGGFGPVYKGVLINGQEIAVKRLSATSGQGIQEMKNEIHFVAKLQHKNLVRLLGYCLEGDEKLLVYEFLPNTSLDKFLFHPVGRMQLDWDTRLRIIIGIARGLLYLHEDSVLRIVHRDLKASNILLDSNMNPKISDFGLAKLFNIDETERNTSRIAGTFGYMAPEYIFHGLFSTKSDVFSYGVLVLEIITGEKTSLGGSEEAVDLLSHVWKHWKEGKAEQLVDKSLGELHSAQEALRCVHIGLLCVQEEQIKRPSMALVNMMLSNSTVDLPSPSIPAFYTDQGKLGHTDSAARSRGFEPPERRTKNVVESIIPDQESQVV